MTYYHARLMLLVLLCCGMASLAFAQAPAVQPVIREIVFRGVEHVPQATITPLIATLKSKVGQPLDPANVRADVEAVEESGWFLRVDSKTETVDGGVRLVFQVVENLVITQIAFVGNTKSIMSDAELLKVVKSRPGTVLNRQVVREDALSIEKQYASQGFTLVKVTDIDITDAGRLQFTIFENRIGEVRIEGNKKTREKIIRRELTFKPGDVYNVNAIRQSLTNLEKLGIFQDQSAVPEAGDQPGMLIVTVKVTESRTGLASIGVGHSNIQGLIGFFDISDRNLWGTGQRLSMRVQFGADSSYELSYTNPYIDRHRTSFTVNLYDRTTLRQAVQGTNTFLYNEKRSGFNFTVGRPISPTSDTTAYITLRNDRIRATQENDNPLPDLLTKSSDVRSIAPSLVHDTRNSLAYPTKGIFSSASVEYAGFGGANFTKFTGEMRRYWSVYQPAQRQKDVSAGKQRQPWVFASRLSVGSTAGSPPFLDQFLVGGADTLRGYKEDRFPGERMVTLNNELRVPVIDALQLVAFVDSGDAWRGAFAQQFGDTAFRLHTGYGLGIRFQTPIGPIRLDYGINAEGGKEFHFGIGPTF